MEKRAQNLILEARIFPYAKSIAGERMTDNDLRKLVTPYVPSSTDTPKQIDVKKANLIKALMEQTVGDTPILDSFGIRPKSNQEKEQEAGFKQK